jgi:hypothetical protein
VNEDKKNEDQEEDEENEENEEKEEKEENEEKEEKGEKDEKEDEENEDNHLALSPQTNENNHIRREVGDPLHDPGITPSPSPLPHHIHPTIPLGPGRNMRGRPRFTPSRSSSPVQNTRKTSSPSHSPASHEEIGELPHIRETHGEIPPSLLGLLHLPRFYTISRARSLTRFGHGEKGCTFQRCFVRCRFSPVFSCSRNSVLQLGEFSRHSDSWRELA